MHRRSRGWSRWAWPWLLGALIWSPATHGEVPTAAPAISLVTMGSASWLHQARRISGRISVGARLGVVYRAWSWLELGLEAEVGFEGRPSPGTGLHETDDSLFDPAGSDQSDPWPSDELLAATATPPRAHGVAAPRAPHEPVGQHGRGNASAGSEGLAGSGLATCRLLLLALMAHLQPLVGLDGGVRYAEGQGARGAVAALVGLRVWLPRPARSTALQFEVGYGILTGGAGGAGNLEQLLRLGFGLVVDLFGH